MRTKSLFRKQPVNAYNNSLPSTWKCLTVKITLNTMFLTVKNPKFSNLTYTISDSSEYCNGVHSLLHNMLSAVGYPVKLNDSFSHRDTIFFFLFPCIMNYKSYWKYFIWYLSKHYNYKNNVLNYWKLLIMKPWNIIYTICNYCTIRSTSSSLLM